MMKKNKLFIIALVTLPLLAACSQTIYTPEFSYPGDPLKTSKPSGGSGGSGGEGDSGGEIEPEEKNMTVYFYLDSSHTEDPSKDENGYIKTDDAYVRENDYQPVYIMKWAMLTPLGKIPERAELKDENAADPLYWKFLGYSEYPTCLDESKLWNFETDYKQSNVLRLYGIWVAR